MPRVVYSSGSEDGDRSDDEDFLPKAKRPALGPGPKTKAPVDNNDSGSEDDDGFIATSEEEGSSSESSEDESSDGESSGSEEEAQASGSEEESSEEDEPGPLPRDVHWTEVDRQYREHEREEEAPGYMDLPQLHAPFANDPDALWRLIKKKTRRAGFCDKYGIQAFEVTVSGKKERVVRRVAYGTKYEYRRKYRTGSYNDVLVPLVEMLFQQQPYIAPPDFTRKNVYSEPQFLDFIAAFHGDAREQDGEDLCVPADPENDNRNKADHGPLWCVCTQCSKKGLLEVSIMQHKPSGIYLVVGGNCANKLVGYEDLKEMHNIQLQGQYHNDTVSRMLGLRV